MGTICVKLRRRSCDGKTLIGPHETLITYTYCICISLDIARTGNLKSTLQFDLLCLSSSLTKSAFSYRERVTEALRTVLQQLSGLLPPGDL